ncbi:hypothetical protein Dda_6223 [Drechslerella dactyloides]|uniref:Uncharacterized protein n=1 Tax=Drechslerella dactyloides TaxID=74499 RepID=A0AAD6IV67_DREDA|nr:hypothetical protein Dda_6223 [Drechslerella dactyloides]
MGPRYTIEELLLMASSPLVQKPDSLPPLEEWMGSPLPTRPTPAPRKPGEDAPVDDKERTGFGHVSRGSEDIILGPPKMSFASASSHNRKTFGADPDNPVVTSTSASETTHSRFAHFSNHNNNNNNDDEKSSGPRIDRFSFSRFGVQKDGPGRTDRNDRGDRGFGRDDNRRDRDGDGKFTNKRIGGKDGDEGGGWNTVSRQPRRSFGHNDDGEKFRREHGKNTDRDRERDGKDGRPNRYEPFSKDRTDRDRDNDRDRRDDGGGGGSGGGGGWKDRDHNKRNQGKDRERSTWFLSEEERAARNAAREREFREQREQRAAEREFRTGGRHDRDRDRDREYRDRDRDLETFGESSTKSFGRGFDKTEKEPEWMDAMPGSDGKEFKAHSTEDFQRWKAQMKARGQQQSQPQADDKASKEPKDEEIVFKSKAEKRATALEEAHSEPVEEPPTPSIAENGVDRFWGWNASSTSLASKTTTVSDGGAKLPVQSSEKTERSSRFRNFFNAPVQDQVPQPEPQAAPVQNGSKEQQRLEQQQQMQQQQALAQMKAHQYQQALLQQQEMQKNAQMQAGNMGRYPQYQDYAVNQSVNMAQIPTPQQQQQQGKDKHNEATKEDREGFNNILQMLGRARLSSPATAEVQNTFLSILGAPSQQGTPVSHTHPTPPTSNLPGPPPPQQQQQQTHVAINRQQHQGPSPLPALQTGAGTGNETILKLLRHSDMPTPQGPPPVPTFLQEYQTPNVPPVSHSPPVHQRGGKNGLAGPINDPAIQAIRRPPNEGPPGLPKNLYHESHQHVCSPSQILEPHHRAAFPIMDIRPPPGIDQRTAQLEAQKAAYLNEQQQQQSQQQPQQQPQPQPRSMDPRHLELLRNEQQRRVQMDQIRQMAAAGELPHGNFPPNAPPRMEQRGPQGPPQPPPPPQNEQGPPMGMPMGDNGPMPGNWAPGPQQHPQSQSAAANQQRPPPGFFGRGGPAGPPGLANGGNVNVNVNGPQGPMPPLPFYGPGPGMGNMPPLPFGQHGMPPPPPPNLANLPNFPPFPPPGPGGPPPMPPQAFPPFPPFHEGMMPFGAGPEALRSPQHQHLGGPPGMFTGR